MYLAFRFRSKFKGTIGSLPNMINKILCLECLLGRKLYMVCEEECPKWSYVRSSFTPPDYGFWVHEGLFLRTSP